MVMVTEVNSVEAESMVGGLGSLQSSGERSESASLVIGREVKGRGRLKVETQQAVCGLQGDMPQDSGTC